MIPAKSRREQLDELAILAYGVIITLILACLVWFHAENKIKDERLDRLERTIHEQTHTRR